MSNKVRNIYEVEISAVTELDEENYPLATDPIISLGDSQDCTLVTADISAARRYFTKMVENIDGFDEKMMVSLYSREIELSDSQWLELTSKGALEYKDYADFCTGNNNKVLAEGLNFTSDATVISEVIEETLRVYSENYNMRVICEKAGISYSTYRGFKYNNQPFSTQKALQLLRCMFEVGSNCWDNEFEEKLQLYKKHASI